MTAQDSSLHNQDSKTIPLNDPSDETEVYLHKTATRILDINCQLLDLLDTFQNIIDSKAKKSPYPSLQKVDSLKGNIWHLSDGVLQKVRGNGADPKILMQNMCIGQSFVLPRPLYNKNREICDFDHEDPLVLNATVYRNKIYFHAYDKEEALRKKDIPAPKDLEERRWYDYILDFFSKFFGARREICALWDEVESSSLLRGEESLDRISKTMKEATAAGILKHSQTLQMMSDNDYISDLNSELNDILNRSNLTGRSFRTAYSSSKSLDLDELEEMQLQDEQQEDPVPERPEELKNWFRTRYNETSSIQPTLIPQKTRSKRAIMDDVMHNKGISLTNKTPDPELISPYDHGIGQSSFSAAYHGMLVFGLAKKHKIRQEALREFFLTDSTSMPKEFTKDYIFCLNNPTAKSTCQIIVGGAQHMEACLLQQEDLQNAWSLQMNAMLKRFDTVLNKKGLANRMTNGKHLKYTPSPEYKLLQQLYSAINTADCNLLLESKSVTTKDMTKNITGQVAQAFLRQVNHQPPQNRRNFLLSNMKKPTELQGELKTFIEENESSFLKNPKAAMHGGIMQAFQSRPQRTNSFLAKPSNGIGFNK
ncbi:MAG: hypothetical protein Q4B50_00210 [Bacillota bacterium]|nr:hypothetical protein [Bacillota bacterium]